MDHFISNSALDICFSISRYAYPQFRDLNIKVSLNEISENSTSVHLLFFGPDYRQAFAKVEVGLNAYTLEKKALSIQIFAEFDLRESEGLSSFKDEDVHSIIEQYFHLKPLVTEGISHFVDNFTSRNRPIKKARRRLTIRYRIHDEQYEEDEDYAFNYDEDEIAKSVIQYLKSLEEIQKKFLDEHK